MTPQKVSDILIRIIDEDWHVYTDDAINALEYAAKVVEKEIPRTPVKIKGVADPEIPDDVISILGDFYHYQCPACSGRLTKIPTKVYCPFCGQKIDWEEIE